MRSPHLSPCTCHHFDIMSSTQPNSNRRDLCLEGTLPFTYIHINTCCSLAHAHTPQYLAPMLRTRAPRLRRAFRLCRERRELRGLEVSGKRGSSMSNARLFSRGRCARDSCSDAQAAAADFAGARSANMCMAGWHCCGALQWRRTHSPLKLSMPSAARGDSCAAAELAPQPALHFLPQP